ITGLAINSDGTTAATASDDATARLWDVATAAPIGPPLEHPRGIASVAFSPDGKKLATGGANLVRFWDPASGRPLSSRPFPGALAALAFSPDGTTLLACGWGGASQFWDLADVRSLGSLVEPPGDVVSIAFSPDGRTILAGCQDGRAWLWDAATR